MQYDFHVNDVHNERCQHTRIGFNAKVDPAGVAADRKKCNGHLLERIERAPIFPGTCPSGPSGHDQRRAARVYFAQ